MQIHIEYTGFHQQMLMNGRSFVPMIYDGEAKVPEGFNSVCVSLDLSDKSTLQWQDAIQTAHELIQNGLWIVWDLRLDLLEGSLEEDTRFMTLQLGIHHFTQTVWPSFKESTIGFILFKGEFEEKIIDYLKLLAALLPDEVPSFLFLDTTGIEDPAVYFRYLASDQFGHLQLALKGPYAERFPFALPALGWGHSHSPLGFCSHEVGQSIIQRRIEYAICFPEKGVFEFNKAIETLAEKPFRIIPESLLTLEWDGIEKLIIFPSTLHERGWRKIRGFEAAGGQLIIVDSTSKCLI